MPSPLFPKPYRELLIEAFTDQEHPAYGQLATVDERGEPRVRSIHFRYLPDKEIFAFGTNVKSAKWGQLKLQSRIAGCYLDSFRQIQFRWEGIAELHEGGTSPEQALVNQMWRLVRLPFRIGYWLDYKKLVSEQGLGPGFDFGRHPPTFGIVLIKPCLWDIYEISPENLFKACRNIHYLKGEEWESHRVTLLHGRDLGPLQG
ncbi:MAG: pyridoxamine 5'-phosphate oxidase family protein [Deltaproteobacteria bacterium]|nr:pyridoxamine 5'-phosphate oxidase family protein [Deltaproteobacteria bacterium]